MSFRWKPQINLRWLGFAVLVIAIGLGWYRDHQQAEAELARLPGEIAVLAARNNDLEMRLMSNQTSPLRIYSQRYSALTTDQWSMFRRAPHFSGNAEEYLQKLKRLYLQKQKNPFHSQEESFCPFFMQIYDAPKEEFDKAIGPLMEYMHVPDPVIAWETSHFMQGLLLYKRSQMQPHITKLEPHLEQCLTFPLDGVRLEAIQCLKALQAASPKTLATLRGIAENDQDDLAVFAVIALGEIDQGYAPPARLMELIQKRWSAWEYAAEILADTMPPSEAHEFLQRLYTDATGDQERQLFARLLNDVALREEAKRGAMTVDD